MMKGMIILITKLPISQETADKLYDDGFHQFTSESGKLLGRVPRLINAALAPLDKWILNREYSVIETKKLLEEKLQNVKPENIVSPEPYVAVPTLQAISYSMNSNELRNMYANLLAKSMTTTSKDSVHPAFVETIKHLSPIDAKVFAEIFLTSYKGVIDLIEGYNYTPEIDMYESYELLETNISGLKISNHLLQSASFNLLEGLNLIQITDSPLTDEYAYSRIHLSNEYKDLFKKYSDKQNISELQKSFLITDFGKLFFKICLDDSIPA